MVRYHCEDQARALGVGVSGAAEADERSPSQASAFQQDVLFYGVLQRCVRFSFGFRNLSYGL